MDRYAYIIAPLLGWVVAQSLKFMLSLRKDGLQWQDFIISGGMPSSHASFTMAITTLIGLQEGFSTPIFGLALALTGVVVYDAMGVRRTVGEHTAAIKEIQAADKMESKVVLNNAKGHTPAEVFFGLLVGIICGLLVYWAV